MKLGVCIKGALVALLAGSLGICAAAAAAETAAEGPQAVPHVNHAPHVMPTRQRAAQAPRFLRRPPGGGNQIQYHGGPILGEGGTINIYLIFYGNWAGDSGTTILSNLIRGLSGSPYFNINTTYNDSSGARVANSLQLAATTFDNYSLGTAFDDNGVVQVVSNAIGNGSLPFDTQGLYFVLTSPDVQETSGFCTAFCGFHNSATIFGGDIKYSFVGNPSIQCPDGCMAQQNASPNNNPGADAMASIMSHELSEAVTDPDLNAWFQTATGEENGDLCNFNFGAVFNVGNGSVANQQLGGSDFLIQQMWVNANGGACVQHFP